MSIWNKLQYFSDHNRIYDEIDEDFDRNYDTFFIIEVGNVFLKTEKKLKDYDEVALAKKVEMQFKIWADRERSLSEKDTKLKMQDFALQKTKEYNILWEYTNNIIHHISSDKGAINWDDLKFSADYPIDDPSLKLKKEIASIIKPIAPIMYELPNEPSLDDDKYIPKYSIWDKLFFRKESVNNRFKSYYESDYEKWQVECSELKDEYKSEIKEYELLLSNYENTLATLTSQYTSLENEWIQNKTIYESKINDYNNFIELFKTNYLNGETESIKKFISLILLKSEYPKTLGNKFELEYDESNSMLIIEYKLPDIDSMPNIKEVKYSTSTKELKETPYSNSALSKLYESFIFAMSIKAIHLIFETDIIKKIDNIIYNCKIDVLDKGTGHIIPNQYIVSLQVSKEQFNSLKLENIDPKLCIQNFNGVFPKSFNNIKPIIPIRSIINGFHSSNDFISKIDEISIYFENTHRSKIDSGEDLNLKIYNNISIDTSPNSCTFAVKGLIYRSQQAIEHSRTLKVNDVLKLVPEPTNMSDPYAVKVFSLEDFHIGYVEKRYAKAISMMLDKNIPIDCKLFKTSEDEIPYIYAKAKFFE